MNTVFGGRGRSIIFLAHSHGLVLNATPRLSEISFLIWVGIGVPRRFRGGCLFVKAHTFKPTPMVAGRRQTPHLAEKEDLLRLL